MDEMETNTEEETLDEDEDNSPPPVYSGLREAKSQKSHTKSILEEIQNKTS